MSDETETWTVTIPIKGEASCTVILPKGSTKYDALRAAYDEPGRKWDETWEFADDPRSGYYPTAEGPGCAGEEVDPEDESQEEE